MGHRPYRKRVLPAVFCEFWRKTYGVVGNVVGAEGGNFAAPLTRQNAKFDDGGEMVGQLRRGGFAVAGLTLTRQPN